MKVAILMGSKSDYDVVKKAEDILKEFNVPYETKVISAHRTPNLAADFAKTADKEFDVIITAAGKSAHLAGVIASHTTLPVIGIPIKTSDLGGVDSLYSIVQMPKGVPVATVAINGSENGALLAIQILSLNDKGLKAKLCEYKKNMEQQILDTKI